MPTYNNTNTEKLHLWFVRYHTDSVAVNARVHYERGDLYKAAFAEILTAESVPPAPSTPEGYNTAANLRITSNGYDSNGSGNIQVAWDTVSGVTQYDVILTKEGDPQQFPRTNVMGRTATYEGLYTNATYFIHMQLWDADNVDHDTDPISATTGPDPDSAVMTTFSFAGHTGSTVSFNWAAPIHGSGEVNSNGFIAYELQASTTENFDIANGIGTLAVPAVRITDFNTLSGTVTGLQSGSSYYFRVVLIHGTPETYTVYVQIPGTTYGSTTF